MFTAILFTLAKARKQPASSMDEWIKKTDMYNMYTCICIIMYNVYIYAYIAHLIYTHVSSL